MKQIKVIPAQEPVADFVKKENHYWTTL